MANRTFRQIQTIEHGVIVLAGRYSAALAGATVLAGSTWFTVARTAEGVFTVTLRDTFFAIQSGTVSIKRDDAPVGAGANGAIFATNGAISMTGRTIVHRLFDQAFALRDLDPAGAANGEVHFTLTLRNSTVNS